MGRWQEFFQNDFNRFSMPRLVTLGAFVISSAVLIWIPTEVNFGAYLTAWVINYIGGKAIDKLGGNNVATSNGNAQ